LAARRLVHQRALTACMLLGMTLTVALASAIPAYVNVAQANVLRQRLRRVGVDNSSSSPSEAFGLLFSYISLDGRRLNAARYDEINAFMRQRAVSSRLPVDVLAIHRTISTETYRVYASGNTLGKYRKPRAQATGLFERNKTVEPPYLFIGTFDVIDGIENHVTFDSGAYPAGTSADQPIEAMIERGMAHKYGIEAGDQFTVSVSYQEVIGSDGDKATVVDRFKPVEVQISGIWSARDARSEFWALKPTGLRDSLVIRESDLRNRVMAAVPNVVSLALWSVQLDANSLSVDAVEPLLAASSSYKREAFALDRSLSLRSRVIDSLAEYRTAAQELNLVLTVFSLPAFAMMIYFLALIAGMVVRQQEGELAILQSRGSSTANIWMLFLLQSVFLAVAAFAIGLPLGLSVAGMIANTRSFLDFQIDPNTFAAVFRVTPPVLRTAIGAALIGAAIVMLPVFGAAERNIIVHGTSRVRNLGKPFWQRIWLDVLLLIPCVYGYYQLRERGSLSAVVKQLEQVGDVGATVARLTATEDPFRDPFRFLIPVLTVTALGLLAARLLPYLVGLVARLIGIPDTTPGPALPVFLALRELARSPGDYLAPLVLLIFTLGVAIFGASAARTLDQHLLEGTLLQTGGNTYLIEGGESLKPPPSPFGQTVRQEDINKPELFNFAPVEEHLKIEGVRNFARVAEIDVFPQTRNVQDKTRYKLYAVDRRAFHSIAQGAFRADYASQSFGDLMNAMGRSRDGLIGSRRFLEENGLRPGDKVAFVFTGDPIHVTLTYTVRGDFVYFPIAGVNDAEVGFVTDIAYTFESLGKEVPYNVLLDTDDGSDGREIATRATVDHEFLVKDVRDRLELMRIEQSRPERQGMFGMLSASFVFITVLTLTGFAVYALLSFRCRSIEIGVMRAMGLSGGQMALYVIFLQTFVVLLGAAIGGGLGVLVSRLYVPFLQLGGTLLKSVPPFFVRLAWTDTLLFYVALMIALGVVIGGSMVFLRRLKVFEVVKLGGG
jgi:putative ABC transport system permease protein